MTEQDSESTATGLDRAKARLGLLIADRYRLDALLGLGGMGAVYRAQDFARQTVAVKILNSELMASDAATRFVRESQVMLSIHHPNVVHTLASGCDPALDLLYLVMPLLHGEDLEAILQRSGALDPRVAVRVAIQAARGIAAAHRLGIVHRDIKPGNLFIDGAPEGRVSVRVCDFGIAKSATGTKDLSLTRTGSQLGTPDYISPEQLKDSKAVDPRADIWGLGATLYEMLSGSPPFAHHERVFDVISAILSEDVPRLQDRAPWIDPELALLVHRALLRNPSQRPQAMDEFADALRPFSLGDVTLTRAELVPVLASVKQVPKPAADAAEPQAQPGPALRTIEPSQKAESAQPALRERARSSRTSTVLGVLGLVTVAVASALFWPELQASLRQLIEHLARQL